MAIEEQLITKNLELWTSAVKEKRAAGRGKSRKKENHGTKKLRELILDLAIKGKLAQADPKDEPASELLAHILKTKDRLAEDGLIKKQKSLGRIEDHELPFAIATNWEWVRLGEIADIVRGVTYRKADASDIKSPNTMPLMRANNIDGELNYNDLIHIPSDLVKDNQGIREGDVLIAMSSGSTDLVGKAAQAKEDLDKTFGAFCGVARSFTPALFDYFGLFFQTPFYRKQTRESGKGIGIQNLNQGALSSLLVPIPPLAEQHRIVAKADELIALCDQLEEEQENNLKTHETLVSTLLNALTSAAADASQFAVAWQRVQENFDILFTTESSVDQLKQTILQLAVMGKLVPGLAANTSRKSLGEILAERSFNGISKGPTEDQTATEVLRISAGTSSEDFYVDETDFKHVNISPEEIKNAMLKRGDLLACRYNGNLHFVGRFSLYAGISKRIQVNPDKLIRFRVDTNFCDPRYVCFAMNAAQTRSSIEAMCSTTAGNIGLSAAKIKSVQIPIPPLPQQNLIVAKVDELMVICDQLKTKLSQTQETQLNLANSIVEQAVKGDSR